MFWQKFTFLSTRKAKVFRNILYNELSFKIVCFLKIVINIDNKRKWQNSLRFWMWENADFVLCWIISKYIVFCLFAALNHIFCFSFKYLIYKCFIAIKSNVSVKAYNTEKTISYQLLVWNGIYIFVCWMQDIIYGPAELQTINLLFNNFCTNIKHFIV